MVVVEAVEEVVEQEGMGNSTWVVEGEGMAEEGVQGVALEETVVVVVREGVLVEGE